MAQISGRLEKIRGNASKRTAMLSIAIAETFIGEKKSISYSSQAPYYGGAFNCDDHVVRFGSLEHIILFSKASLYTHTYRDLIYRRFYDLFNGGRKMIYLHHGTFTLFRAAPWPLLRSSTIISSRFVYVCAITDWIASPTVSSELKAGIITEIGASSCGFIWIGEISL